MNTKSAHTILVVDDTEDLRNILCKFINSLDFNTEVVTAENGQEGVEKFIAHNPDCVFMDIMMPVMDGLDACTEIRKLPQGKDTPIIFCTAKTDKETVMRTLEVGGTDFIIKPFSRTTVEDKLRRFLVRNQSPLVDALMRFMESDELDCSEMVKFFGTLKQKFKQVDIALVLEEAQKTCETDASRGLLSDLVACIRSDFQFSEADDSDFMYYFKVVKMAKELNAFDP